MNRHEIAGVLVALAVIAAYAVGSWRGDSSSPKVEARKRAVEAFSAPTTPKKPEPAIVAWLPAPVARLDGDSERGPVDVRVALMTDGTLRWGTRKK